VFPYSYNEKISPLLYKSESLLDTSETNTMKRLIKKFLFKYVHRDWNIAVADMGEDLVPVNIKWMKHDYKDRWFADPFIVDEIETEYIVLAEEYLRDTGRGRLAKLTVSKDDCRLIQNETILDIDTHLSFPNTIDVDGCKYLYPENAASGATHFYQYNQSLFNKQLLLNEKLADAVIWHNGDKYYLFATVGVDCNGNRLAVYKSNRPFEGYTLSQELVFKDNTARRAGNVFQINGKVISPAQICNNDYGEGISLQELTIEDGTIRLKEIKRMMPLTKDYPNGYHTYNVWNENKVIIDGYRYGSQLLHDLCSLVFPKNS